MCVMYRLALTVKTKPSGVCSTHRCTAGRLASR